MPHTAPIICFRLHCSLKCELVFRNHLGPATVTGFGGSPLEKKWPKGARRKWGNELDVKTANSVTFEAVDCFHKQSKDAARLIIENLNHVGSDSFKQ